MSLEVHFEAARSSNSGDEYTLMTHVMNEITDRTHEACILVETKRGIVDRKADRGSRCHTYSVSLRDYISRDATHGSRNDLADGAFISN